MILAITSNTTAIGRIARLLAALRQRDADADAGRGDGCRQVAAGAARAPRLVRT